MNTVQSTVGRGANANPTPQMAQNAAQMPLTSDGWQSVQPDIYKAQSELLDLVDSFMEYTNPIVAINQILERWLMAGPDELNNEYYKPELVSILRLISFLTELRDSHQKFLNISFGADDGEVSHV